LSNIGCKTGIQPEFGRHVLDLKNPGKEFERRKELLKRWNCKGYAFPKFVDATNPT